MVVVLSYERPPATRYSAPTRAAAVTIGGDVSPFNAIKNVSYGVWEDNAAPNGFGAASANMGLAISGLNINAGQYGVYIDADPSSSYNVAASITGGNITAGTTGILVSGANANASLISGVTINDPTTGILISGGTATITGNAIKNNSIGIDVEDGGSAAIDTNTFTGNGLDLQIGLAGLVTSLTGNSFSGTQFINNESSHDIDATTDSYYIVLSNAQVVGNALSVAAAYTVEDRITDYLDDSSDGFGPHFRTAASLPRQTAKRPNLALFSVP